MPSLDQLHPFIRLSINNPEATSKSAFGRGVADLCLGVRNSGSLNAAAKSMGMAYSKAWRIMKDTESALGVSLLNRDGAHGSTLTPEGDLVLDTYIEIEQLLQEQSEKLLKSRLA